MLAASELPTIDLSRWWEHGSCRDLPTAWWFPVPQDKRRQTETLTTRKARNICAGCPVRAECLADGLIPIRFISATNQASPGILPKGIMGGLNEKEREALLDKPISRLYFLQ